MKKTIYIITMLTLSVLVFQGCKEEKELFPDPYSGGKEPLGVKLDRNAIPNPDMGIAGTEVTIPVTGLVPYKQQLSFMFNGVNAEVVELTETSIKVKVPPAASTGVTSIAIGDQLVIGPQFTVTGKINVDPTFKPVFGTNGFVSQFFPLSDGRFMAIGGFTNYDNKGIVSPINRIARVSPDGEYDRTFRTGKGVSGVLYSMVELNGKFYIAGGFGGYNTQSNISNITRLNSTGSIDTLEYDTYRTPEQADTAVYFPRFNGGTDQAIRRLYKHNDQLVATGNFRYYVTRTYSEPNYIETRDTIILDSTEVRQIIRFNQDGTLDKTYRFDTNTNNSLSGANGNIDSYMHTDPSKDGKLVVFGSFSTFDKQPAGGIIRLNPDGTKDETFNPGSGTGGGAGNGIASLTYNEQTQKYIITGGFITFNGKPAVGVAVLNYDGSLDESFKARAFGGGNAYFAKQLSDGLIVVNGNFRTYDGIFRNGFMVLNPAGELAAGYNATGNFGGGLNDVIETQSADGKRALLLIGGFYRFDNKPARNMIRVTLE